MSKILFKVKGIKANLHNGIWGSEDKELLKELYKFDSSRIKFYSPFIDLDLVKLVIKIFGGEIIEIADPPEYVEGRIY